MIPLRYTISFYDEALETQVAGLPVTLLARYLYLVDRMVTVGPNLGAPHTKAMGEGLFEMRLKGAEGIARVMYCTLIGQRIVVLHSFIKKTDKTPKQDLALALKRLKEIKNADA
jgi:phage-related protein